MSQPLTVPPGTTVRLSDFDPGWTDDLDRKQAGRLVKGFRKDLAKLGYRLYGEDRQALLLVLQGMDASGKDGTIRSVMKGFNPQGCHVTSFKVPSDEERDHGFLWRIHRAVPRHGNIGIFNRSQYEDVLVVRVHRLVPDDELESRYDRINDFERLLVQGRTTIVKCFLHISREEQRERLQARLDDPERRWKFNRGDLAERALWDDYQHAYETALTRCNSADAPWHIIPADRKWYRDVVIARLLVDTLTRMNPQLPPGDDALEGIVVE